MSASLKHLSDLLEKCRTCVLNNTVFTVLPYVHESLVTEAAFLQVQVLDATTLCGNGLDSCVSHTVAPTHTKFLQLGTMNADYVKTIVSNVTLPCIKGSQFQAVLNYVSYADIRHRFTPSDVQIL